MTKDLKDKEQEIKLALIWCLAWGNEKEPQEELSQINQLYQGLKKGEKIPSQYENLVKEIEELLKINGNNKFPKTIDELKELTKQYPNLWNNKIGLVYGGATKIKQYVFETSQLPYIRGASALLDRINLVDIPCFFRVRNYSKNAKRHINTWLENEFPGLSTALVPELLIYYKGGNILAFCPKAWVNDLANAIEKRYTEETLTANSCAVGETFKPLEMQLGILPDEINDNLFWWEKYQKNLKNPLVKAYYHLSDDEKISTEAKSQKEKFINRKSFNELVTKLAIKFNQRRNGNKTEKRPSRAYPPVLETHPYLVRDNSDCRLSMATINELPNEPNLSEVLARKRRIGEIVKREKTKGNWYKNLELKWSPTEITIPSWVAKFEKFLKKEENYDLSKKYYQDVDKRKVKAALSLREIGNCNGRFVGYIYADGNNMGGYIQTIKTPQEYKQFSEDIFEATEFSVYKALAQHLHPYQLDNLTDPDNKHRQGILIHPFEIITIGGDDVMLVVPANKALAIAKTIGEEFEEELKLKSYTTDETYSYKEIHRYQGDEKLSENNNQCKLSMSSGVLITGENTPIYYAENLTQELLKSAKTKAKSLKKVNYYGGTIDFFIMKTVTMLSSSIQEFREEALTQKVGGQQLRLYAAPYTLYEIEGLITSLKALQASDFPQSQLYQIRSLLPQGKNTAILNYRYFITRLKKGKTELQKEFELPWCKAKTNKGNIAPWMFEDRTGEENNQQEKYYETIWRDLVDLLSFSFAQEIDSDVPENTSKNGKLRTNRGS